jgi:hypothetical protein
MNVYIFNALYKLVLLEQREIRIASGRAMFGYRFKLRVDCKVGPSHSFPCFLPLIVMSRRLYLGSA